MYIAYKNTSQFTLLSILNFWPNDRTPPEKSLDGLVTPYYEYSSRLSLTIKTIS